MDKASAKMSSLDEAFEFRKRIWQRNNSGLVMTLDGPVPRDAAPAAPTAIAASLKGANVVARSTASTAGVERSSTCGEPRGGTGASGGGASGGVQAQEG